MMQNNPATEVALQREREERESFDVPSEEVKTSRRNEQTSSEMNEHYELN